MAEVPADGFALLTLVPGVPAGCVVEPAGVGAAGAAVHAVIIRIAEASISAPPVSRRLVVEACAARPGFGVVPLIIT
ncbi:hypothetical protein [Paenarthrobacter sp. JL.01a]|uniref:hypothetical protein n=1 Tax=Paenarthrobacter sp. JL.01a TaxID=2979324 RepID=UPI0021C62AEF|nr:hypothetical protein [Paenarthrobacter sp. JL.01a]UXM90084.1 hypothetical protein N5P29_12200 [Paenarthrobacter sp. JL.01a]